MLLVEGEIYDHDAVDLRVTCGAFLIFVAHDIRQEQVTLRTKSLQIVRYYIVYHHRVSATRM